MKLYCKTSNKPAHWENAKLPIFIQVNGYDDKPLGCEKKYYDLSQLIKVGNIPTFENVHPMIEKLQQKKTMIFLLESDNTMFDT